MPEKRKNFLFLPDAFGAGAGAAGASSEVSFPVVIKELVICADATLIRKL